METNSVEKAYLSVSQDTNNRCILHLFQLCLNLFLSLLTVIFLGIFSKCLLLGFIPVLIESPPHFLTEMLSPNCIKRTKTSWCLHISHNPNNNHWWGFNNCHSLTCLLLVKLCMNKFQIRHVIFWDMHASQMQRKRLGGIDVKTRVQSNPFKFNQYP